MFRPALALLTLMPLPALAEPPAALPMTYAMFEASLPHVDMALCPVDLAGPGLFCRLAVLNEQIHVFVFSEEGESPMVGFKSWPVDLMVGLMD